VWGDEGDDRAGCRMHRYGLRWSDASSSCVRRLREVALAASGERRTPERGTGPVPRPVVNG